VVVIIPENFKQENIGSEHNIQLRKKLSLCIKVEGGPSSRTHVFYSLTSSAHQLVYYVVYMH